MPSNRSTYLLFKRSLLSLLSISAASVAAQTVYGPGTITSPVSVTANTNDTIVSGSSISSSSGTTVNVTNGHLTVGDTGGTVTISSTAGNGLLASGSNAFINAVQANVSTFGDVNDTVIAKGGGQITLTGGTITYTKTAAGTGANQNAALQATDAGSLVTANNAAIIANNQSTNTSMNFAFGVNTANGGHVVVNGGTIDVTSSNSTPPRAYGANAGAGVIDLNNVAVGTTGTYSHGVVAAGGTANVNGGTILTRGGNSAGLYSTGSGGNSTIVATGTTITSQAYEGVFLDSTSATASSIVTATINNVTISAPGILGGGLSANGATRLIDAVSSTITSAGTGASAMSGATIRLRGGYSPDGGITTLGGTTITTTGSTLTGYGAMASGVGSLIDSSDTWQSTITTNASSAYGVYATSSGTVMLTNDKVTTNGATAHGAYATSGGALILNNNTIHTYGNGADGIAISGATSSALTDGANTVTTESPNAHGFAVLSGASKTFNGAAGNVLPSFTVKGTGSAMLAALGTTTLVSTLTLDNVQAVNGGSYPGTIGVLAQTNGVVNLQNNAGVTVTGASSFAAFANQGTINASDARLSGGNGVQLNNNGKFLATRTAVTAADVGFQAQTGTAALPNSISFTDSSLNAGGTAFYINGGFTGITINHSTLQNGPLLLNVANNGNTTLTATNTAMSGDVVANDTSLANLSLIGSQLNGNILNGNNTDVDASSRWRMSANSDVAWLNNAGAVGFIENTTPGRTLTVHNDYNSTGGLLTLNTALGDDSSATDKLIVQNNSLGSGRINIINFNGQGDLTSEGIEVVHVDGASNASFTLTGRLVAGIYEYDLFQGSTSAPTDGNWYLRSLTLPSPPPPPEPGPGPAPQPKPAPRPETGVYLRNMTAASTMFMHTLHDRLGEPQYTDNYPRKSVTPSIWIRVVGDQTDSQAADGQIDLTSHSTLVHFGGDLARWTRDGNDRWLFGLMGAYGRSDTDADPLFGKYTSSGFKRTANGSAEGYSAGAYLTWYGNKDKPTGPYVDAWAMYGWFNNKVQGNMLPEEKYDSTDWTVSIESGYAFIAHDGEKRQWIIEPQAQLAYNSYSADNHQEANGTWVRDGDQDGIITRLGARAYSRSKLGDNGIQPFVELNWWYGSAKNTLSFNDMELSDDTPDSRYELKVGLQGELARGWQMWGHIGGQWGENHYSRYEGMLGLKKTF